MTATTQSNALTWIGRRLDHDRLALAFLALSILIDALLVFAELSGLDGLCVTGEDEAVFVALTSASAVGLVLAFLLRAAPPLSWMLWLEGIACLAFVLYFPVSPLSWIAILTFVVVPVSLYLPFPRNILSSAAALAFACLVRFVVLTPELIGQKAASFRDVLLFVLAPLFASALLSLLSAFRKEMGRLGEALLGVTRINLSYQDYSASIEEKSALEERLRLTRDIHDVVGYALTNTIMMLRAASLMCGREPEKVPALLETARVNADSALAQVREILGDLRRREIRRTVGPGPIAKVVRMFRLATGAEVDLDFGNFDWEIGDEEAIVVNHFVQEGMLNAFSHGKATAIRVAFRESEGELLVSVKDNGGGAKDLQEGIGISGMRERTERLGGSIEYGSQAGGFSIQIRLPLDEGARPGGDR